MDNLQVQQTSMVDWRYLLLPKRPELLEKTQNTGKEIKNASGVYLIPHPAYTSRTCWFIPAGHAGLVSISRWKHRKQHHLIFFFYYLSKENMRYDPDDS